jgi:hypothetical protein
MNEEAGLRWVYAVMQLASQENTCSLNAYSFVSGGATGAKGCAMSHAWVIAYLAFAHISYACNTLLAPEQEVRHAEATRRRVAAIRAGHRLVE